MGALNQVTGHPAGHQNVTGNVNTLLPGNGASSRRPSSLTSLSRNNSKTPNTSVCLNTTVRMNGNAISTDLAPKNGKTLTVNVKLENGNHNLLSPSTANNIANNGSGFESQISTVSNSKDPPQIAL